MGENPFVSFWFKLKKGLKKYYLKLYLLGINWFKFSNLRLRKKLNILVEIKVEQKNAFQMIENTNTLQRSFFRTRKQLKWSLNHFSNNFLRLYLQFPRLLNKKDNNSFAENETNKTIYSRLLSFKTCTFSIKTIYFFRYLSYWTCTFSVRNNY